MNRIAAPSLFPVRTGQRITRLRLWHVPLTSHTAYYMSEGKTCATVETVVIALDTDSGHTGWGEVCLIPHYLPAYARGVAPALQELAPIILGGDPVGAEALMAKADAFFGGTFLREVRAGHRALGLDRASCGVANSRPDERATARGPAALSLYHLR